MHFSSAILSFLVPPQKEAAWPISGLKTVGSLGIARLGEGGSGGGTVS